MRSLKGFFILIATIGLISLMTTTSFAALGCYKVRWKNKYDNSVHYTYQQAHSAEYAKIKVANNGPTKDGSTKVLRKVPMSYCR